MFEIFYMILGILVICVGVIVTIVSFGINPLNHIWSIPLIFVGVLFICVANKNLRANIENQIINNMILNECNITERNENLQNDYIENK